MLKQVAQEEATLAKLRNVPGKLPVRVQHSLVSAGTQFTCFTGAKSTNSDAAGEQVPRCCGVSALVLAPPPVLRHCLSLPTRIMMC